MLLSLLRFYLAHNVDSSLVDAATPTDVSEKQSPSLGPLKTPVGNTALWMAAVRARYEKATIAAKYSSGRAKLHLQFRLLSLFFSALQSISESNKTQQSS